MARTGVSYEDVERVATQLYQQGLTPTVQRVRQELGTGSNTTISRHLKSWHETFYAEDTSRIPMAIPEEVVASVDGFWAAAVAKADANYQQYREEVEIARDLAIEEKDAALLRLAEVEQHNQELQQQLHDAQHVIQQRNGEFQHLQGQYDELGAKYDAVIQESNATKTLAHAANEQAKQAQLSIESHLAEQQQQYDGIIKDLKRQLESEESRYEALENRHLVKVDELQQLIKQADQHANELDRSLSDQQKQIVTNQQLFDQQLKQLESEYSATKRQLKQSQDNNTSLQQALKNALSNYETNLSQNKKLFDVTAKAAENQTAILKEIARLETVITSTLTSHSKPDQDDKP